MNPRITDTGRAYLLSPHDWDVLKELASGHNVKETAMTFHVSPKSVERYRAHLYRKTGYNNLVALARFAIRTGLIEA